MSKIEFVLICAVEVIIIFSLEFIFRGLFPQPNKYLDDVLSKILLILIIGSLGFALLYFISHPL